MYIKPKLTEIEYHALMGYLRTAPMVRSHDVRRAIEKLEAAWKESAPKTPAQRRAAATAADNATRAARRQPPSPFERVDSLPCNQKP